MSNQTNPTEYARLIGSFEAFLEHMVLLHGFTMGQIQRDMAQFMTAGHLGLRLHTFRGASKSFTIDCYCVWRIFRNPDTKIMLLSAKETNASRHIKEIRRMVQLSPLTKHWTYRTSNQTMLDFAFSMPEGAPSIMATSIDSTIEGSRADILIADDVEAGPNSKTPASRAWIRQRFQEMDNICHGVCRFIPKGESLTDDCWQPERTNFLVVGTFWSRNSAYLPDSMECADDVHPLADYAVFIRPALDKFNESNFPEKFPTSVMLQKLSTKTKAERALQYELCPSKIGDLQGVISQTITLRVDPNLAKVITLFYDPTGERIKGPHRISGGRDEAALVVCGLIPGGGGSFNRLHVFEITGCDKRHTEQFIRECIIPACNKWNVERVQVESNIAQAYNSVCRIFAEERRSGGTLEIPVAVMPPFNATTNKHERIIQYLEPNLNAGLVTFQPEVLQDPKTVYQLEELSYIALPLRCDRIDALAQGVESFATHLAMPAGDKNSLGGTYIRDA